MIFQKKLKNYTVENMKKILVINTVDYILGGISSVIINYYTSIDLSKFKIDFVVNSKVDDNYKKIMLDGGAKLYYIERNHAPLKYFISIYKIVKKEQYDIVYVHGNSCTMAVDMLAARLGKCKKIIAHSHSISCDHKIIHCLLRPIFEISCDKRIACSDAAGRWLFHKKKFEILPNAMEIDKYKFDRKKRENYRKKLNIAKGEMLIGHVGYFNVQKNQLFLIDVLKELINQDVNCKMLLVGKGELKNEVEEYANSKGIKEKVIFFGVSNDIPGLMSAMDVFLFPSRSEGLGMVMIEAQINGLPCVASLHVPAATKITDECYYCTLAKLNEWVLKVKNIDYINRNRSINDNDFISYDIKVQSKLLECFFEN